MTTATHHDWFDLDVLLDTFAPLVDERGEDPFDFIVTALAGLRVTTKVTDDDDDDWHPRSGVLVAPGDVSMPCTVLVWFGATPNGLLLLEPVEASRLSVHYDGRLAVILPPKEAT